MLEADDHKSVNGKGIISYRLGEGNAKSHIHQENVAQLKPLRHLLVDVTTNEKKSQRGHNRITVENGT